MKKWRWRVTVCVGLVGESLCEEGIFRKSRVSREMKEQAHFASSLLLPCQLSGNLSDGESWWGTLLPYLYLLKAPLSPRAQFSACTLTLPSSFLIQIAEPLWLSIEIFVVVTALQKGKHCLVERFATPFQNYCKSFLSDLSWLLASLCSSTCYHPNTET